jgi:hypothetical protein
LSWRLFGTDPQDNSFGFNVYKGTTKLNSAVITSATCYQDNSAGTGTYTVRSVANGVEEETSENALVISNGYYTIPLTPPPGGTAPDGSPYTETANDCSIGDLDGDGIAEVACKTAPGTRDGTGSYLKTGPAAGADNSASYVITTSGKTLGYVLSGPEWDGRCGPPV